MPQISNPWKYLSRDRFDPSLLLRPPQQRVHWSCCLACGVKQFFIDYGCTKCPIWSLIKVNCCVVCSHIYMHLLPYFCYLHPPIESWEPYRILQPVWYGCEQLWAEDIWLHYSSSDRYVSYVADCSNHEWHILLVTLQSHLLKLKGTVSLGLSHLNASLYANVHIHVLLCICGIANAAQP